MASTITKPEPKFVVPSQEDVVVELVTHCYAIEFPHYAVLLKYQLSSLVLHPPKCKMGVVICCVMKDAATAMVIQQFCGYPHLNLTVIHLTEYEIGRRSIGRNLAAIGTDAKIVWHTDVDHCFVRCLDKLAEMEWPEGTTLVYPRHIQLQKTHEMGDLYVNKATGVDKLFDVDPQDFQTKGYSRAIGGVHVVQGDFARKYGYLRGNKKWQKTTKTPFSDFRDDIAYRNFCASHGDVNRIDLPGVYRIRHTETTHGK